MRTQCHTPSKPQNADRLNPGAEITSTSTDASIRRNDLDGGSKSSFRHQLYIPKPAELNDPKEARPKIAAASVGRFIKMLMRLRPPMSAAEELHHRRVLEFNLPRFGGADFVMKEFEEGLPKQFENQRIYSLTKRPNNRHLWKKYALGHSGYCLEFRNDDLFKNQVKEVRYHDTYEADITGPSELIGAFSFTRQWIGAVKK